MCLVCLLVNQHATFTWNDRISVFSVSEGSVEALIRWGGKNIPKYDCCFLSNIFAKYYKNPSMLSRVIAKNVGDVFWDTVYIHICPSVRPGVSPIIKPSSLRNAWVYFNETHQNYFPLHVTHVVNTLLRRPGKLMARDLKGSRSFTCTPRVHPLTEWTTPALAFQAVMIVFIIPPLKTYRKL